MADISISASLKQNIRDCLQDTVQSRCGEGANGFAMWNEIHARMLDQVLMFLNWHADEWPCSATSPIRRNPPTPSAFHHDVFDMLGSLGLAPELEAEGFDILIRASNIAIEVNGPSHYALDLEHPGRHAMLGRSLLKQRVTAKKGYALITVPWWEWGEALHEHGGRELYLKTLIAGGRPNTCKSDSTCKPSASHSHVADKSAPSAPPWVLLAMSRRNKHAPEICKSESPCHREVPQPRSTAGENDAGSLHSTRPLENTSMLLRNAEGHSLAGLPSREQAPVLAAGCEDPGSSAAMAPPWVLSAIGRRNKHAAGNSHEQNGKMRLEKQ